MKAKKTEKNTAAKKTATKETAAAVKPDEAAVVNEIQEDMPKADEPASETEAAAPAKKPAKTAASKKPAAKKESPAAKAPRASIKQKIVLQISGNEVSMENIVDRVKEAYVMEGHVASSIKDVAVYIKPEENMVYYVIDEYASGISLM